VDRSFEGEPTMAKRHHSSHHSPKHSEGHYEGLSSRRDQEMHDAGMIRENHAAIANLPQEVMIKPWPSAGSYLPEGLDDTIRGVNQQEALDDRLRDKHMVPKKV
jgi:hypothetical protein